MQQGHRNRRRQAAKKNENVIIALVGTQSPGNIGSVARVMRNTGFSRLALVDACAFHNNEAYSMACKATDVLFSADVHKSLDTLLDGECVVVGTTRRVGRTRYPIQTIEEAAPKILELSKKNKVVMLFGREDRGLENEEIALCDMLVEVPTSSAYPSLNLSHAVFAVCHDLFLTETPKERAIRVAPREELEEMYAHMERSLRSIGYGDRGGAHLLDTILRNFRRLYGRTGLMQKEVNMLRGIFTQIETRTSHDKEDR